MSPALTGTDLQNRDSRGDARIVEDAVVDLAQRIHDASTGLSVAGSRPVLNHDN